MVRLRSGDCVPMTAVKLISGMAILTAVSSVSAAAQVRPPLQERSIRSVLTDVQYARAGANASAALLSQANGDVPAARLDSLARGLVELSVVDRRAALTAIGAFTLAANPSRGRPYNESFERLVEIFRRADNPGSRGAALGALRYFEPRSRALAVWREVATQQQLDPGFAIGPSVAVNFICAHGGLAGQRLLRQLYARGELHPDARKWVAIMIKHDFKRGC